MNFRRMLSHLNLKRELAYRLQPVPRKIIFDHLPKCGGSTLNRYLKVHYPSRKVFTTDVFNLTGSIEHFKNLPKNKRYSYSLVIGHLSNELFDYIDPHCIKVTVLRDPVERIISHYYYAKGNPNHYLYSIIHNSKIKLDQYVESNFNGELRNWYTTHFTGLSLDLAEDNPQESIAKAVEVLSQRYDIIGFLDNLSSFIETLRKQANLRYEFRNMKVNVTKNRTKIESIPHSTIEKIEQLNSLDIAFYKRINETLG